MLGAVRGSRKQLVVLKYFLRNNSKHLWKVSAKIWKSFAVFDTSVKAQGKFLRNARPDENLPLLNIVNTVRKACGPNVPE